MRVATVVRALPGVGAARTSQLMVAAGIDRGRRAGALTTGQRERLLAAAGAMDAKLTARRGRRHHSGPMSGRSGARLAAHAAPAACCPWDPPAVAAARTCGISSMRRTFIGPRC